MIFYNTSFIYVLGPLFMIKKDFLCMLLSPQVRIDFD